MMKKIKSTYTEYYEEEEILMADMQGGCFSVTARKIEILEYSLLSSIKIKMHASGIPFYMPMKVVKKMISLDLMMRLTSEE